MRMSCDLVLAKVCGEKVGSGDETKPLYERGTDLYVVLLLLRDYNMILTHQIQL